MTPHRHPGPGLSACRAHPCQWEHPAGGTCPDRAPPRVAGLQATPAGVTLMERTRIYALAQKDHPPAMQFPNASAVPSDYDFKRDLRYFEALAKFLDHEPVAPDDMAIRGMAASLGIVKGQPFQPDARMQAMLNTAANVAFNMAAADSYDSRYPNKLIYPDRKWEVVFLGGSPVFRKDSYLDFDAMINFFHKGYSTSTSMVLEMPGKGSQYLLGLRDADGDYLSGGSSYRLHVPAQRARRELLVRGAL